MNRKRTYWCATGLLGLAALAVPVHAGGAGTDAGVARLMVSPGAHGQSSVIARLNGPLTADGRARLAALGADITRNLPIIQSVALRVPTHSLGELAALPFITHLSYDGQVRKCDAFTLASSGAGQATQQYGLDGTGVTVAVVDSGVRACADLGVPGANTSRVALTPSQVPGDTNNDDLCGHGTHVAGIIAGNGTASTGPQYTQTFYGIARRAGIVSVRVLDANGQASVSTVLAGIQWVVNNRSAYKIRVLNLSLGHPVGESYTTDPLCRGVEAAWKAGIVVVCAAGNSGRANATQTPGTDNEGWGTAYGSIQSPGNDPYVITVGATKSYDGNRAHDRIATYSSRGPSRLDLVCKPDILAPGNRVVSSYSYNSALFRYNTASGNGLPVQSYQRTTWNGFSTDYFTLSGTSMAAPVVAGAAALLLQKYPTLTPDTVKARLMASADKWAGPDGTPDLCTYGAGYLDIPAALQNTISVPAGAFALSPRLVRNADGSLSLDANSLVAANHVVWGTVANLNVVWGSNVVWGTNVVWGSHVVWGSSVWGDHVIWGSSTSAVDLSCVALKGE